MHSINKERRKLQIDSASEKQRYRMYKSGKTWMFASATMLFFGAEGIFGHANIVKADETEASTHTATVQKSIANTVTIHYVDTLGNEIAPTQTLANGKSGDGFVTPAAPTVAGYELLDPATQSGAFTDGQQNITVKYAKVTATNTNASAATTASIATSEAQAPISEVAIPEIPTTSAAEASTSSATVTTPASAVSSAAVPQTSATPNVASKQAATSVAPVQPTSVAPSSNAEITVQPAIANNAIQPTNQLSQAPASDSASSTDRPSAVGLTSEQARQAIAAAAQIANTKFQAPVAFDTGTSARTGQQIQPVDLNVQAFAARAMAALSSIKFADLDNLSSQVSQLNGQVTDLAASVTKAAAIAGGAVDGSVIAANQAAFSTAQNAATKAATAAQIKIGQAYNALLGADQVSAGTLFADAQSQVAALQKAEQDARAANDNLVSQLLPTPESTSAIQDKTLGYLVYLSLQANGENNYDSTLTNINSLDASMLDTLVYDNSGAAQTSTVFDGVNVTPIQLTLNNQDATGVILPGIKSFADIQGKGHTSLAILSLTNGAIDSSTDVSQVLANLPGMTDLSNNGLSGTVAVNGDKSGIINLNLSNNNFSGSLSFLNGMTYIQKIDVSDNQFSGSISGLGGFSVIKQFIANNNQLTGSLSSALAGSTTLGVLNVANNNLSGTAPTLSQNMDTYDISNNSFTGDIGLIASANGSQVFSYLNIAGNTGITGDLASIKHDANGFAISFGGTGVKFDANKLAALKVSSVSYDGSVGTKLTDADVTGLDTISTLTALNLANNNLTKIPTLPQSQQMVTVNLAGNKIAAISQADGSNLQAALGGIGTNVINLAHNQIASTVPSALTAKGPVNLTDQSVATLDPSLIKRVGDKITIKLSDVNAYAGQDGYTVTIDPTNGVSYDAATGTITLDAAQYPAGSSISLPVSIANGNQTWNPAGDGSYNKAGLYYSANFTLNGTVPDVTYTSDTASSQDSAASSLAASVSASAKEAAAAASDANSAYGVVSQYASDHPQDAAISTALSSAAVASAAANANASAAASAASNAQAIAATVNSQVAAGNAASGSAQQSAWSAAASAFAGLNSAVAAASTAANATGVAANSAHSAEAKGADPAASDYASGATLTATSAADLGSQAKALAAANSDNPDVQSAASAASDAVAAASANAAKAQSAATAADSYAA